MAFLDDRQEERKRDRHRAHAGGLDIVQQRFELPLSFPGVLAVVHARGVQEVVEADASRSRSFDVTLEPPARQGWKREGGPPPPTGSDGSLPKTSLTGYPERASRSPSSKLVATGKPNAFISALLRRLHPKQERCLTIPRRLKRFPPRCLSGIWRFQDHR